MATTERRDVLRLVVDVESDEPEVLGTYRELVDNVGGIVLYEHRGEMKSAPEDCVRVVTLDLNADAPTEVFQSGYEACVDDVVKPLLKLTLDLMAEYVSTVKSASGDVSSLALRGVEERLSELAATYLSDDEPA